MASEHVILLHGLAENPLYMLPMQAALTAAGYTVSNFGYPSTKFDCRELTDRIIAPLIAQYADVPRLHLVGHSMGCILIRAALQKQKPANLGRVVMLAPGNGGSEMLQWLKHNPLQRILMGPSLIQSGTDEESFALNLGDEIDYEAGVLAGAMPADPMSFWLPWPHDGRISVWRAQLEGAQLRMVPSPHDMVQAHPWAITQTLYFLARGRFV